MAGTARREREGEMEEREREGSETLPYHNCASDPQLMEAHLWRPEIKIWSSKGHISKERVYSVCIPPYLP